MANGNSYVIQLSNDGGTTYNTLSGQMDGTIAQAGTLIDVTNKASGGYIEYYEGFVAGKQVTWSGSMQMIADADQKTVREAVEAGTFLDMKITDTTTDEAWAGKFAVTGRSDSAPLNGNSTTSLNVNSSGVYAYTPPTV